MAVHCICTPGKYSIEHRINGNELYLSEEVLKFSSITESWLPIAESVTGSGSSASSDVLVLGTANVIPDADMVAEISFDGQLLANSDGWYDIRDPPAGNRIISEAVVTISRTKTGSTVYALNPKANAHHLGSLYRVLSALNASIVDRNVCYVPYRDSIITKLLWKPLMRSPSNLTLLFAVSLTGTQDETKLLKVAQLCHSLQTSIRKDPENTSRVLWAMQKPQKGRIMTTETLAQIEKAHSEVLKELLSRYEVEADRIRFRNQQKRQDWERNAAQRIKEHRAQLEEKSDRLDYEIEILNKRIEVVSCSASLPRNDEYVKWEEAEVGRIQILIETRTTETLQLEAKINEIRKG